MFVIFLYPYNSKVNSSLDLMHDSSNDVSPRDENASKYFRCFIIKANVERDLFDKMLECSHNLYMHISLVKHQRSLLFLLSWLYQHDI